MGHFSRVDAGKNADPITVDVKCGGQVI